MPIYNAITTDNIVSTKVNTGNSHFTQLSNALPPNAPPTIITIIWIARVEYLA